MIVLFDIEFKRVFHALFYLLPILVKFLEGQDQVIGSLGQKILLKCLGLPLALLAVIILYFFHREVFAQALLKDDIDYF